VMGLRFLTVFLLPIEPIILAGCLYDALRSPGEARRLHLTSGERYAYMCHLILKASLSAILTVLWIAMVASIATRR
jgi:hypothetical protein